MSRTHDITISAFDLDRLEGELEEQTRLLGMSAERECDLRGNIDRLERELDDAKRKHRAEHDLANEAIATWKKAKEERDALQEQLNAALMLGKMQERRHERELEQVREQYRLSSVCRRLLEENKQLKGEQS